MAPSDPSIAQHAQNMEQFHRLIHVGFGNGDLTVADELFAPDFIEHQAGVQPPTAEGVKGLITYLHQAFPDLTYTVEDLVADGDRVWGRMRAHGTQQGAFMGSPPTGASVTLDVIDICRFRDGKIVEHWGVADRLGALEQLGHGRRVAHPPRQAP
jgi:predicted ester cyclase